MCTRGPNEESYEFFENIVDYIKKAKDAESTAPLLNAQSKCNSFMVTYGSDFKDEEKAKRICEQFINLYNSLNNSECNLNSVPKNKKCSEFLNYWVNFKLRESMKNEGHTVSHVYDLLESEITGAGGFSIYLKFICDINKNELNKMNILYSLYEKYSKLNTIIDSSSEQNKEVLTLSSECCNDYIVAKYMCNGDYNKSKFCEKLKDFESKYDELYNKFERKRSEFSDNLIKLSECPNNRIISTAVTGSIIGLIPLLGVLYKFTPMGQRFRSKKGILNNDVSNNDEEMTNMPLMEQGNEPIRFQQGTYNIKYQSL